MLAIAFQAAVNCLKALDLFQYLLSPDDTDNLKKSCGVNHSVVVGCYAAKSAKEETSSLCRARAGRECRSPFHAGWSRNVSLAVMSGRGLRSVRKTHGKSGGGDSICSGMEVTACLM